MEEKEKVKRDDNKINMNSSDNDSNNNNNNDNINMIQYSESNVDALIHQSRGGSFTISLLDIFREHFPLESELLEDDESETHQNTVDNYS
jgi:hypothetical protein